jgi:Cu(I)/Ag(I) efflux system membrane fusion protein
MSGNVKKSKKPFIVFGIFLLIAGGFGYYYFIQKPKNIPMMNSAAPGMGMPDHTAPITVKDDTVTLSERARQVAGVQTTRVRVRELVKDIKTTGKVVMNETSRSYITSRIEGRVDELHIFAEGEFINAGQLIAHIYSPSYIAAQEEYLYALENRERFGNGGGDATGANDAIIAAARRKLELLNAAGNDIRRLELTRKAQELMPVYAQFGGTVIERLVLPGAYIQSGDRLFNLTNLSSVWINTDIYEKDIAAVQINHDALITSQAYPGEVFNGKVVFISPVLDDATRTIRVRVRLDNREGKLRPNMFVNVAIKVPLGESLIVPESAVLDSGETQTVFIAQNEGTFKRRDVVAGQYVNGYVQILSGLESDDTVVSAAAFLIDSQTKLGGFSSHGGHGGGQTGAAK